MESRFISSLLTATLFAVYMLAGTSCNQSRLQIAVNLAKSSCPFDMGLAGVGEDVELEEENVVMTLKLNEQFANIKALEQNKEQFANTVANLMAAEKNSQNLLKIMVEENIGLEYKIIGNQSGEKMNIVLPPDQIKSILNKTKVSSHDLLLDMIKSTKIQLPMKVDPVTTLKDMELEDDNVVYTYDIDENQANMDNVNIELLKSSTIENTKAIINDMWAGQFLQTVINDGKNVCYRYFGDKTGKKVEFVITNDELMKIRSGSDK